MSIQSCVSWTMINCHCVVIEFVLLFFSSGLAVVPHFLFSFFFLPLYPPHIFHVFHRFPKPKPVQRLLLISCWGLASSVPVSCLRWQDIYRWFLVPIKYIAVFPLWQMDLRLLVLNKCRFTIHNFTRFVLYITGLNILSQNSSAWHFQLV